MPWNRNDNTIISTRTRARRCGVAAVRPLAQGAQKHLPHALSTNPANHPIFHEPGWLLYYTESDYEFSDLDFVRLRSFEEGHNSDTKPVFGYGNLLEKCFDIP